MKDRKKDRKGIREFISNIVMNRRRIQSKFLKWNRKWLIVRQRSSQNQPMTLSFELHEGSH